LKYYNDDDDDAGGGGDDNLDDDDCMIMNVDEPQISTGFLHVKNFFLNSF
jgi:hypothetical protein